MTLEALFKLLRDENFASPYGKNHSSDYVLGFQPVEKVMFVYKLLAGLDSDLRDSSQKYTAFAQFLFDWLNIPSIMVSGLLKAHPEEKHFWNVVTVNGYAFHFDAYFAKLEHWKKLGHIEDLDPYILGDPVYHFFCASTSRISQTHVFGEEFPQVDCSHNLSHALVRDLASMRVSVRRDPFKNIRKIMRSGMIEPKPESTLLIDYIAASIPITLSFE